MRTSEAAKEESKENVRIMQTMEAVYEEGLVRPIEVEAEGAEALFRKWVGRGDLILAYENKDMGHPNLGHRIFMPCDAAQRDKVRIGIQAPDGSYGLGWRYRLIACTQRVEDFVFRSTQ